MTILDGNGVGQTVMEEVYQLVAQLDFGYEKTPLDLRNLFLKMAEMNMISPEYFASIERGIKK